MSNLTNQLISNILFWLSRKKWLVIAFFISVSLFYVETPEGLTSDAHRTLIIVVTALILIVSEIPTSLLDSLNVRVFAKFFAIASIDSYPCFPVNVFAFPELIIIACTSFFLSAFSFQSRVQDLIDD